MNEDVILALVVIGIIAGITLLCGILAYLECRRQQYNRVRTNSLLD
jgi:nitrate reductase gamma subunit